MIFRIKQVRYRCGSWQATLWLLLQLASTPTAGYAAKPAAPAELTSQTTAASTSTVASPRPNRKNSKASLWLSAKTKLAIRAVAAVLTAGTGLLIWRTVWCTPTRMASNFFSTCNVKCYRQNKPLSLSELDALGASVANYSLGKITDTKMQKRLAMEQRITLRGVLKQLVNRCKDLNELDRLQKPDWIDQKQWSAALTTAYTRLVAAQFKAQCPAIEDCSIATAQNVKVIQHLTKERCESIALAEMKDRAKTLAFTTINQAKKYLQSTSPYKREYTKLATLLQEIVAQAEPTASLISPQNVQTWKHERQRIITPLIDATIQAANNAKVVATMPDALLDESPASSALLTAAEKRALATMLELSKAHVFSNVDLQNFLDINFHSFYDRTFDEIQIEFAQLAQYNDAVGIFKIFDHWSTNLINDKMRYCADSLIFLCEPKDDDMTDMLRKKCQFLQDLLVSPHREILNQSTKINQKIDQINEVLRWRRGL